MFFNFSQYIKFSYHLNNGIPILLFFDEENDIDFLKVAYYLISIANADNLTLENKKYINLEYILLTIKNFNSEKSEDEFDKESDDIKETTCFSKAEK